MIGIANNKDALGGVIVDDLGKQSANETLPGTFDFAGMSVIAVNTRGISYREVLVSMSHVATIQPKVIATETRLT